MESNKKTEGEEAVTSLPAEVLNGGRLLFFFSLALLMKRKKLSDNCQKSIFRACNVL